MLQESSTDAVTAVLANNTTATSFNTFISAIEAAGLRDVLASQDSIFTLLAPTDAAFEELGSEALDEILGNPETLRSTVLYHVLAGRAFNTQELANIDGRGIIAGNGSVVTITADGEDNILINNADITYADIGASLSLIHI